MLAEQTVLVVGAGAGSKIGMPLGSQLSGMIAERLNITTNVEHRLDLELENREDGW
jgi:hypothetical protein